MYISNSVSSLINFNSTANATTILINVSGTTMNWTNGQLGTFLASGSANINKVIWNFHQATSISTNARRFAGALLAPLANVDPASGNLEGSVLVRNLLSTGEIHLPVFGLTNTPPLTGVCGSISVDYGDAPDTGAGTGTGNYNTTSSDNGPSHVIATGVYLGAGVDPDNGSLQNTTATADDSSNTGLADDEDGVTFLTPLAAGKVAKIQVTASVAGCLNAWVDYNGNGVLTDSGEQIAANLPVAAGANTLNVTAPATAQGVFYSRFRFTTQCGQGGQSPTGPATSGEVEDYVLAALGDYVWVDTNVDGIQNDSNTGLNRVTVKLLSSSGSAVLVANGNPITTLTADNPVGGQPGWYEFAGLPAGSYIVQFMAPDGYTFTTPFLGGDPALDGNANGPPGRPTGRAAR